MRGFGFGAAIYRLEGGEVLVVSLSGSRKPAIITPPSFPNGASADGDIIPGMPTQIERYLVKLREFVNSIEREVAKATEES